MRAGPLSDAKVIELLNANFVNTWVLKQELPFLRDNAPDGAIRRLAGEVHEARQKKSPVDCLVLSLDAKLVVVKSYHDAFRVEGGPIRWYFSLLGRSLEELEKVIGQGQ